MKPAVQKAIFLGFGTLIDYLRAEKPLRTWIRARRAKKGKGPILGAAGDKLAEQGLDEAAKRVTK